jgi:hypothetical protein
MFHDIPEETAVIPVARLKKCKIGLTDNEEKL